MEVEKIRKMSDKELQDYITKISGNNVCYKCGEYIEPDEKRNIYIGVYGRYGQQQRKLCSLCNDCYVDLLDYIGISDIKWGE